MRTADTGVLRKPHTAVRQKFRRLDPANRALDECSELLALFVADGRAKVLNLHHALTYENNLRDFRNTRYPRVANELRVQR